MSTSSLFYKDKYAVSAYDAHIHVYFSVLSVAVFNYHSQHQIINALAYHRITHTDGEGKLSIEN